MKERPIIFNGAMVRAILSGKKTQTRRAVKLPARDINFGCWLSGGEIAAELASGNYANSAFGKPGDRLWVRESCWIYGGWQPESDYTSKSFHPMGNKVAYQATDEKPTDGLTLYREWRGTPSIHMPRKAARILLEITDLRVERLNDISEQDALAEGMDDGTSDAALAVGWFEKPRRAFQRLWAQIYGQESWEGNPWVWVVEFKQIKIGEVT